MNIKAWHHLCVVRDDVRSGKLTMDEFAADLNDARTKNAPAVYHDPGMFFDRTYPTHRMKTLTASVLSRLTGNSGTPVMRLQVAYGGGKTHTLITLLHLVEQGHTLTNHPTVKAFLAFSGLTQVPQARVALLPGDKIDIKEGLAVYGLNGQVRQVKTLWGALAYQLAGDAGYARLQAHDQEFTVPAEPILVDLLRAPQKDGLGSLILVDEAVWYYRSLVNLDPRMLGTIKDFYQVLTQAVAKVPQAVMVASLIASYIEANDATGTQCLAALEEIFGRIAEPVEPVTRDDIAEILRRRLFASYPMGKAERQEAVDSMMSALHRLPLPDNYRDQVAYDRYLDSYPFHPELINVLYQKWTQLDNFQRTRGALRLLATALREAEGHDPSPVIGVGALLRYRDEPERSHLSPALSELVEILSESHKWLPALTGELGKAKEIQATLPSITRREVEQAVVATFLHSQPQGQRATHPDLLALLAHPVLDAAAIEEGTRKWRERSWFLVENPDVWQLGTLANLTHMHYQAAKSVPETEITDELRSRIRSVPELKSVDPGVALHVLPQSPRDVEDNLLLHYLILEPACAVSLGQPIPPIAEAYFNEKTGRRIYRNNIVALVPEAASVAGLREQVRRWLGWKRLEKPEAKKLLTKEQELQLPKKQQEATNNLPESVVGAYRILLAVNETGSVEAHTLRSGSGGTPFERIKALLSEEERLVATTLDADLILPDSYFTLWAEGQTHQRVTDLMGAFGQYPRLPRLLRPASLVDTLKHGVQQGVLVLRLPRPDGSAHTWWRTLPDEEMLRRPEMEVVPVTHANLHDLPIALLKPGALPGLWPFMTGPLNLEQAHRFFDGSQTPRLFDKVVLDEAVRKAVSQGALMVRIKGTNLYREEIPGGVLTGALELYPPPSSLGGGDLTPQALPDVWQDGQARLVDMVNSLGQQVGYSLPWTLITSAVNEALNFNLFTVSQGTWPCSAVTAEGVVFRQNEKITITADMVTQALRYTDSRTPTLAVLKETIETVFFNGRTIPEVDFGLSVEKALKAGQLKAVDPWHEGNYSVRIRRPDKVLFGETQLSALELERLAEHIDALYRTAEGMNISFRVAVTFEGELPDEEIAIRLNEILARIQPNWKLTS